MKGDTVIGPQRPGIDAQSVPETRLQGQRQRRVRPAAERSVKAHSPVTDLVAEPLDHNRPVVRHRACGRGLVVEISEEILDGAIVEPGSLSQAFLGRRGRYGAQLANHLPQRETELGGPALTARPPERDLAPLTHPRSDHSPPRPATD